MKGMVVLLPLLGLTWVFGIMAINKDTIVFQYLFAILNSLQVRTFFAGSTQYNLILGWRGVKLNIYRVDVVLFVFGASHN